MTLEDLSRVTVEMYGFKLDERNRNRDVVYARKVFVKLAKDYGYRWHDIKPFIGSNHDLCIYHYDTFSTITPKDLDKYNILIEYFNLPMEKIPSMQWYIAGKDVMTIMKKLKKLSRKDLAYFKENTLEGFLKSLKKERELKKLYKSKTSGL